MIIFSHASMSDLTIERGRLFPLREPIELNQERQLTENKNPKVIDYGGYLNLWEMRFEGLSKDNYDGVVNGLKTWFQDSNINWAQNNFTLTDESGTDHTMRYWADDFDMPADADNRYSITLILLKE